MSERLSLDGVDLLNRLRKQVQPNYDLLKFSFSCRGSYEVDSALRGLEDWAIFEEKFEKPGQQIKEVVGSRRYWGYCGVFERDRITRLLAELEVAGYSPETAVSFRPVE